jgi:hypothetical protein
MDVIIKIDEGEGLGGQKARKLRCDWCGMPPT